MSTFVLIHGTWLGGWAWDRVLPFLREAGHQVFAPDLPGLGGDAHSVHADIDPFVHAAAIVDLLDAEDLRDVVLVGHSYGGIVAQQASASDRVARVVFVDAFLPETGESAFDLLPWLADAFTPVDAERPWLIAPLSPAVLGIEADADAAWLTENMTPMPLATHTTGGVRPENAVPGTYISCVAQPIMAEMADRARGRGYDVVSIPTVHLPMITHPELLAETIQSAADASQ